MKLRVFHIFCLATVCLFNAGNVFAELSVANQWRIEQATDRCKKSDNAVILSEYWQDSVTDENRETVCIAEQFAQITADEGDPWLENKSVEFINLCKTGAKGDDSKYYTCLQKGLKNITKQISSPCRELGKEGLWDEDRCRRLISYIFIKDFDKVLQANRPLLTKVMDNEILKFLFNPIIALIFLLLYVADVVYWTDPGNWLRIPKFGFVVGTIILGSWFFQDKLRFIGMGSAILICAGGIIRNHTSGLIKKPDKKKGRYFRR